MATYETAQDRYVNVGGIRFAYRRLGRAYGVPLVLLMHFRFVYVPTFVSLLEASRDRHANDMA